MIDEHIMLKLNSNRDKWGKMLNNLGCPKRYINDFIQDTYLKIYEMDDVSRILLDNGEVNMYYIYFALRSRVVDYYRQNKLDYVGDIRDTDMDDELDIDNEVLLMNLYQGIMTYVDQFGAYGSKLCKVYLPTSTSLRQLATDSGISVTSIHHSMKQYKAFIREEFEDEYEAYKRHKKR